MREPRRFVASVPRDLVRIFILEFVDAKLGRDSLEFWSASFLDTFLMESGDVFLDG